MSGKKNHGHLNKLERRSILRFAGVAGLGGGLATGALDGAGLSPIGRSTAAPGETVVEDFETTDLSTDYNFDRGASGAEIVGTTYYSGNQALALSGANTELISTGQFGADAPAAGDTFSYRFRITGDVSVWNFTYGVQDHDNRYYIQFDYPDSKFRLYKYLDGSGNRLDSTIVTPSKDTWYKVKIDWNTDGTHTVTLFDAGETQVAQLTGSDGDWTSGEIGFDAYQASSSGTIYFDYVTLESSDGGGGGSSNERIIDSFEDGDLTEWDSEFNQKSLANIVSSPTHHGTQALELSGQHFHLFSQSGLAEYPQAGDTFSGWVRGGPNNTGALVIVYGVQGYDNHYVANVNVPYTSLLLRKTENGTHTTLDKANISYSNDTWYEVEVDWGLDGTHTVSLYDVAGNLIDSVSATDSTWTNGGIGCHAHVQDGGTGYFDHLAIKRTRSLGNFETDLDGWTASGANTLARVTGSQQPAAVTRDDHALEVSVNSDPEPVIENQQRIQLADLETHPCLVADVLPASVQNSTSPVTFRFRYHHTDPGGVEVSHEMTVDQEHGGRICWDMSELSATKRSSPDRLELVWYPTNHPPGSGFDYNGVVYVDNIRLTNDQDDATHAERNYKDRELRQTCGHCTDRTVSTLTGNVQSGELVYSDGTRIPYEGELLADGTIRMTIDGETFRYWGDNS